MSELNKTKPKSFKMTGIDIRLDAFRGGYAAVSNPKAENVRTLDTIVANRTARSEIEIEIQTSQIIYIGLKLKIC